MPEEPGNHEMKKLEDKAASDAPEERVEAVAEKAAQKCIGMGL